MLSGDYTDFSDVIATGARATYGYLDLLIFEPNDGTKCIIK